MACSLTRPDDAPELSRRERVLLRWEIFSVFAVSLGASGVSAFVSLIGSLTARHSLASQSVTLNGSQAPGRPLLDLSLQLVSIASGVAPVVLVFYLLARSGDGAKSIGVDRTQPLRDFLRGAGLAALIGGSGLGLYFIAYKSGIALNVVAENEPNIWWRYPMLLLSALQNGLLEEVLVTGYLLTRLRRLGVNPRTRSPSVRRCAAPITCTRVSAAFSGNAIMGDHLRHAVPALAPRDPDDHRPYADRRGGLHRLRTSGRPRFLAYVVFVSLSFHISTKRWLDALLEYRYRVATLTF